MAESYDLYVAELDARKRLAADASEYWMARDLQPLLGYSSWDKFEGVIGRAIAACKAADVDPDNQFSRTGNVITAGKGAQLERADWFLSRYACYLIAMNADASKREVAYAQTYFAVQTRRQEIEDLLTGDEKRAILRERVRDANKNLTSAAKRAGVQRYAIFQDAGYKGLYGGIGVDEIKRVKGIPPTEDLLDCAGRVELAANEFRITQTEQKLAREKVSGEAMAIRTHADVGREVRRAIAKINGTMPEKLSAEPNIKKLASQKRRALKAKKGPKLPI